MDLMDYQYSNQINLAPESLLDKTFNFIIKLMGCRDQLRINHWQTTSYAEHKWTDAIIGDLTNMIDSLAEYALGAFERPQIKPTTNNITDINLKNSKSILECLCKDTSEIIQEYKITEYEGMINLLGELDGIIKKFKFLSTLE